MSYFLRIKQFFLNDLLDVTVSATAPVDPAVGDFWVDIS
jgi:hypothetical protein